MTEPPKAVALSVLIARYVDASQPGWVECHFHDAAGQLWKIVEKVPVVTGQEFSESTELPTTGSVDCVEISRRTDQSGLELVVIDTELPFGIEATDGTHIFEVLPDQLQELSRLDGVKRTTKPDQVEEIEQALITAAIPHSEFAAAIDMLLTHLLSQTRGVGSRATDGVLLEHFETNERHIAATGIAILIDQTVEPLRIELNLDSSRTAVDTGALYFGEDSGPVVGYGSPAHSNLTRKILANPDRDFGWRHSWHRTKLGWARDLEQPHNLP